MKVAFIVDQFPSLSQTFILNQITGLIDRGCEVHIYAHSGSKANKMHADIEKYSLLERTCYFTPASPSDSKMLRLMKHARLMVSHLYKHPAPLVRSLDVVKDGWQAASLVLLRKSLHFLERGPYSVIHCQFGPNGMLAARLRDIGAFEAKIITHFRGADCSSFVQRKGSKIYEELFRKGDLFLCVSERIRQKLIRLGCDESKIAVHRSGVDLEDLSLIRPRPDHKIRLLTIARLVEKKGVQYGIEAVARLVPRHPTLQYRIVGDGPLRSKLASLIRRLHMDAHIKLLGNQSRDEVRELLRDSDIVLTPSVTSDTGDEEGIPVAIMEAFASGLPVVSTRHGGIPEIVHDGESGFLVPERDIDLIAEKVEHLINRPQLRYEMGRTGRRYVEEYHDIDRLNDRLLAIYRRLTGKDQDSCGSAARMRELPDRTSLPA